MRKRGESACPVKVRERERVLIQCVTFLFSTKGAYLVWWIIDALLGVRNPPQVERAGQDLAELGIIAYPEFMVIDDDGDAPPHR